MKDVSGFFVEQKKNNNIYLKMSSLLINLISVLIKTDILNRTLLNSSNTHNVQC